LWTANVALTRSSEVIEHNLPVTMKNAGAPPPAVL
jgi:hypothetical protein